MGNLPSYKIEVYGNEDELPRQAEELFADELASSREPFSAGRSDAGKWSGLPGGTTLNYRLMAKVGCTKGGESERTEIPVYGEGTVVFESQVPVEEEEPAAWPMLLAGATAVLACIAAVAFAVMRRRPA